MEFIQKMMVLLIVSTFAFSAVSAGGGINSECQDLGFDSGIAKWEWDDGWYPEGDAQGTLVSGTDIYTEWDVGTSNATGIVVKAGSTVHYAVRGTSGIVEEVKPATSHITFCYDDNEVPEFGTIGAGLALIGAVMIFVIKKKK